ncbi:MAG: DUF177 domain-containing protein [Gaiellales bacterium]|nr:MAG: DUF177 domain-containing protein [Gaiellales bacterium]
MPPEATTFDLVSVNPGPGEKKSYELDLYLPPLEFAGREYAFVPDVVAARLDLVFTGEGYHATISFICRLEGACWRCLEPADLDLEVRAEDYFELELPPLAELGEDDEPSLYYTRDGILELSAWAHDAVAGMLPPKILCFEGCKGLCDLCGANLNEAQCGCERPSDSRWDKLKEWKPEA